MLRTLGKSMLTLVDRRPQAFFAVFATVVLLTGGLLGALRTAHTEIPRAELRYQAVGSVITTDPSYQRLAEATLTQARVELRSGPHKGATAILAVDEQAARGDDWAVYWDTERSRIWRTDTPGATPYPSVTAGAVNGGAVAMVVVFVAFVLLVALAVAIDTLHRRWRLRRSLH